MPDADNKPRARGLGPGGRGHGDVELPWHRSLLRDPYGGSGPAATGAIPDSLVMAYDFCDERKDPLGELRADMDVLRESAKPSNLSASRAGSAGAKSCLAFSRPTS
jgi:hypothetical protein